MRLKLKIIIAGVVTILVLGGAGVLWFTGIFPFTGKKAPAAPVLATEDARYLPLEKLVVMLRADTATRPRYLLIDLVFKTEAGKNEKLAREQLPLLRAVSYQALSEYSAAEVMKMRPADYSKCLKSAYTKAYGAADEWPFSEVLVSKVMVD